MTNASVQMKGSLLRGAYVSVRQHLSIPLFANAYALVTNQVLAAGLGILYWALAARLYPVAVVGENSALISSIVFLAMFAELSMKGAMTRFVPRGGKSTTRLILGTVLANVLLGLAVSGFLLTIGRRLPLTASLLESTDLPAAWLIIFAISWTLFYVQDGILIGMRQAKWVVVKNILYSLTKIGLLVVFLRSMTSYGLAAAWFLPAPFFIIAFGALIFWRFMPRHQAQDLAHTKRVTWQELLKSITGDHVGTILAEAAVRVLPLVVLAFLGAEATAYFNQAWIIAATFQAIATNMASSFIVEASADMQQISLNSRRILGQMLLLIVPAVLVMCLGARLVLYIFGKDYSEQSFSVLRWLVVATIPYMFNAWYLGYARVLCKVGSILAVQGAQLILTVGASYLLLPRYGIDGIGLAWLAAQTLIALGVLYKAIPILWPRASGEGGTAQLSRNRVLRRVDWRFLLPISQIKKSVCLSEAAHLQQALEAVSATCLGRAGSLPDDCDVAAAVQPKQSTLLAAGKALRADGVLYSEWSGWLTGGKWGVEARLERAGFKHNNAYWVYPNPEQPQFCVPLDSGKAPLRYLAQSLLPGTAPILRVLRAGLVELLAFAVRGGLVPHLAVISDRGALPREDIFQVIRSEYQRAHPQGPGRLSFLVKCGGTQLTSKIVMLVFDDPSAASPVWVVKIPRLPEDAVTLKIEQSILTELNHLKPQVAHTCQVPSFLWSQSIHGVELYAQTALTGRPFGEALSELEFPKAAALLTEAQVALAEGTACCTRLQPACETTDPLLSQWVKLADGALDQQEIARTREVIASLGAIPQVCAHNDFAPWNIVETKEGLGILDWSDAHRNGLPLLDLVYALTTAAFRMASQGALEPAGMQKAYRQLLDPHTPLGAVFQACLDSYARRVGVPPQSVGPLRLATWIKHSLYELENHKVETGEARKPLDSVCIPLWRMELQIQAPSPDHGSQP